jgi:hypothetical protein
MSAWKRYTIGILVLVWLFGNIPAWLFLPAHTYSDGSKEYLAIWWTLAVLLVPISIALAVYVFLISSAFVRWIIGPKRVPESPDFRAQRIARLERELGIEVDE